MIKQSGHLFHIDFGKFLGDAQMFGSFNRDRTPFIFTPDMVYVINGGDKPTVKFQYFVDLCCFQHNLQEWKSSTQPVCTGKTFFWIIYFQGGSEHKYK